MGRDEAKEPLAQLPCLYSLEKANKVLGEENIFSSSFETSVEGIMVYAKGIVPFPVILRYCTSDNGILKVELEIVRKLDIFK